MNSAPVLPNGHKVNIGWTSKGRRLVGTCWTNQVESFLERRILPESTDIVLVHLGRRYELGDKAANSQASAE